MLQLLVTPTAILYRFHYEKYEHHATGGLKDLKQSAMQKIFFGIADECESQPNFF
jgi:hypothetical protein